MTPQPSGNQGKTNILLARENMNDARNFFGARLFEDPIAWIYPDFDSHS
jgi:hypothetical protein